MRKASVIVVLSLITSVARGDYEFKTVDYPGAAGTHVNDINDNGVAVGYYWTFANQYHAFKYENGTYTNIDPVSLAGTSADYGSYGITNDGRVVGFYRTSAGTHGYQTNGGSASTFDKPGQVYGFPTRINNNGDVIGYYDPGTGIGKGYIQTGGSFKDLSGGPINTVETQAYGLNDSGMITGQYFNAGLNRMQGFLLDGTSFSILDPGFVGETQSTGVDLNNAGTVVGNYFVGGNAHGFVYSSGVYRPFDVPGSSQTGLVTINNLGVIGGVYVDALGREHGFIANPVPEPSSIVTLAVGGVIMLARARRLRRG